MDIERARELIVGLADGVDPLTGEVLPDDHLCNKAEIVRALHALLAYQQSNSKSSKNPPPNSGNPWTDTEIDELSTEFDSGMKLSTIARAHGRSRGSIEARLSKLGKIERSYFDKY